MKHKTIAVKFSLIALCIVASLSLCACGGGSGNSGGGTTKPKTTGYEVEGYERTNKVVDSVKRSDGRYEDGHQLAFIKDTLSTVWFDFTVNGVEFVDEYGGKKPEAGYYFAVANITIKNTFGEAIELYYNDFWLASDFGNGTEVVYAYEYGAFENGKALDDAFTLDANKKITVDFVYEINGDAKGDFIVEFYEEYNDGVYGNDFIVVFE